jgi:hypothetical protein
MGQAVGDELDLMVLIGGAPLLISSILRNRHYVLPQATALGDRSEKLRSRGGTYEHAINIINIQ